MINWENIKTESIENINIIVDDAGVVLLEELTETKIAGVDLQEQCQFNLDNYKLACNNLGDDQDNDIITKAQTFIDS
jgi:hypothetical protein